MNEIVKLIEKHWKLVLVAGVVAIVLFIYGFAKFKTWAANLVNATWWQNLFGQVPAGTQIPDSTGSIGQTISNAAQNAAYVGSQGWYDVQLAAFAKANGFPTSLSAQGSALWPWTTYDQWVAYGEPDLPT